MQISIILPVYNAEKTVGKTIQSVIDQDCKDWELIVIDDYSSDNSLNIIKNIAKKDSRIRVFCNSQNLGPAASRNLGIENAKGKYIGFIDADDTYRNNFISIMISNSENYETEITWCNYIVRSSKNNESIEVSNSIQKNKIFSNLNAVSFFFYNNSGLGSVCNKVYLKDFVDKYNLRFNTLRIRAEDWEFNLLAFSKVTRIVLIEDYLYNYFQQNNHSLMSCYRKEDYILIWRSIDLLTKIKESFNLDHSLKHIYEINSPHLIEFFYKSSISNSLKETKIFFKEKRFLDVINLIDIGKLPKTYKIICKLLKLGFWNTSILFSRSVNIYNKILQS